MPELSSGKGSACCVGTKIGREIRGQDAPETAAKMAALQDRGAPPCAPTDLPPFFVPP